MFSEWSRATLVSSGLTFSGGRSCFLRCWLVNSISFFSSFTRLGSLPFPFLVSPCPAATAPPATQANRQVTANARRMELSMVLQPFPPWFYRLPPRRATLRPAFRERSDLPLH